MSRAGVHETGVHVLVAVGGAQAELAAQFRDAGNRATIDDIVELVNKPTS